MPSDRGNSLCVCRGPARPLAYHHLFRHQIRLKRSVKHARRARLLRRSKAANRATRQVASACTRTRTSLQFRRATVSSIALAGVSSVAIPSPFALRRGPDLDQRATDQATGVRSGYNITKSGNFWDSSSSICPANCVIETWLFLVMAAPDSVHAEPCRGRHG